MAGWPRDVHVNLRWPIDDSTLVYASLREGALTVARGREDVQTFDHHGRWLAGHCAGRWWRRGMDGRSVGGVRGDPVARPVGLDAATAAHDAARASAGLAAATMPDATRRTPQGAVLHTLLQRAVAWDRAAATKDAKAFAALYAGPIPVVPGDLPRALYLQATRGCAWNRCSYCSLYAGMAHTVESAARFDGHVRAVLAWYGDALPLRRTVFIGDADVLVAGPQQALQWLDVLDRHVERAPPRLSAQQARAWQPRAKPGIWEVDAFAAPQSIVQAPRDGLRALSAAGLGRLYLGLETGDPQLRKRLHRPESLSTVAESVRRAKAAGLDIALMVIAGLGGRSAAQQHVAATAAFIDGLPLGEGDHISLSPLIDPAGSGGTVTTLGASERLDEAAIAVQVEQLRGALGHRGVRVAPYDLAGFVP